MNLYVWLATVAVVTATVAPLARRRMVYERRRWIVLEALRKFNALTPKLQAIREAFLQIGMATARAGEQMRRLAQAASTEPDRKCHDQE